MKLYIIRPWEHGFFALFKADEEQPIIVGGSPKKLAKIAWAAGADEVKHAYDGSKLPPEEQ